MSRIDPYPRQPKRAAPRPKSGWPAIAVLSNNYLPLSNTVRLLDVIDERRTYRTFEPADLLATLSVVRHTLKIRAEGTGPKGGRYQKACISAGALHPIDVLVVDGPNVGQPLVYDDRSDTFLELSPHSSEQLTMAVDQTRSIIGTDVGHLLILAADNARTASIYGDAESLVWRDAGAALQLLAMVAFSYGLVLCPLGVLADAAVKAVAGTETSFEGCGAAILGRKN